MRKGGSLKQEMFYCPPPISHHLQMSTPLRDRPHVNTKSSGQDPLETQETGSMGNQPSEIVSLQVLPGVIYCKHNSAKATIVTSTRH